MKNGHKHLEGHHKMGGILLQVEISIGFSDGDVYLVKTDGDGNEQWSQTYGGTGIDSVQSNKQMIFTMYFWKLFTNINGIKHWEDPHILLQTHGNGSVLKTSKSKYKIFNQNRLRRYNINHRTTNPNIKET